MTVALPEFYFYILCMVAVGIPLLSFFLLVIIHKSIPWAFTMYLCYLTNQPCVFMHYPKGMLEIARPKLEKDLKPGVPQTYFYLKEWGIKIPDISGDNTELMMGKLRIIHYFKNNTAPINILDTVSLDRLKNWLNSKGVNIQNREDVIFYFLNQYINTGEFIKAVEDSAIEDTETKQFIINAIKVIDAHRSEIEALKIKDGIFTLTTAMMALDKVIAFTSAAFSNAKSAIEAQVRAKQLENKNQELYRTVMVIAVLLICAALAYAIISKSGVL